MRYTTFALLGFSLAATGCAIVPPPAGTTSPSAVTPTSTPSSNTGATGSNASSNTGSNGTGNTGSNGTSAAVTLKPGLQANGAIAFRHVIAAQSSSYRIADVATASERVEISAPIFPNVGVLYTREGDAYPSTTADQEQLVRDTALTFDFLLTDCASSYPEITLPASGSELTAAQLSTNYRTVARCGYEKHTSKPYWIPQLVKDVDMCSMKLGTSWRLLSEADITALTEDDYTFLSTTLTDTESAGGAWSWGTFYFSLNAFVRMADGTIKRGDLAPASAARLLPFDEATNLRNHYEGGLSLRCIRRTVE